MIQIKKLSGDYIVIETAKDLDASALREMMPSPFPVFFLEGNQLERLDRVPKECELCVVFQSYRAYFVWCGGDNSVWPGENNKVYCIDCSSRELIEWDPSMITANDAVAVDYLSFGLYSQYTGMIKDALDIDYIPIDMDRDELFVILDEWKSRAERDDEKLDFREFFLKYNDFPASFEKYLWLFRVTDHLYSRTALEWISRVTE